MYLDSENGGGWYFPRVFCRYCAFGNLSEKAPGPSCWVHSSCSSGDRKRGPGIWGGVEGTLLTRAVRPGPWINVGAGWTSGDLCGEREHLGLLGSWALKTSLGQALTTPLGPTLVQRVSRYMVQGTLDWYVPAICRYLRYLGTQILRYSRQRYLRRYVPQPPLGDLVLYVQYLGT